MEASKLNELRISETPTNKPKAKHLIMFFAIKWFQIILVIKEIVFCELKGT